MWLFLAAAVHIVPAHSAETAPKPDGEKAASKSYVLVPNDVVSIHVYQEEDLTTEARVSKEGTIPMALLGSVKVGGLTVEEARQAIEGMLAKDYLVSPQVILTVKDYSKRSFVILGQVQKPGTYQIANEESLNLLQAIAVAGGYTRLGSPSKITVQRTVNGEQKIYKLDAGAMAKDKDAKPFEILPEDVITVGERLI